MGSMGGHESQKMKNDEWLTPPEIVAALGPFDLDPCSPINRPWATAERHFTREDNGLWKPWEGRVWLNPPYSSDARKWILRLSEHGRGTALIFARTETEWFWDGVWRSSTARAALFFEGRLCFYYVDGTQCKTNAGAPSVLVAYGDEDANRLRNSGLAGAFVSLPVSLTKTA